jgi:hypothetical protein
VKEFQRAARGRDCREAAEETVKDGRSVEKAVKN